MEHESQIIELCADVYILKIKSYNIICNKYYCMETRRFIKKEGE